MKLVQAIIAFFVLSLYAGTGCQPTIRKISKEKLKGIDKAVTEEIQKGSFPGPVVLVGRADEILYHRAFGHQIITPGTEVMNKTPVSI